MFPIGTLLAVFRLLLGAARTVGTGDVSLLFRLCLHLATVFFFSLRSEHYAAASNDIVNISRHNYWF